MEAREPIYLSREWSILNNIERSGLGDKYEGMDPRSGVKCPDITSMMGGWK